MAHRPARSTMPPTQTDTCFPRHEQASDIGRLIASVGRCGARYYIWASAITVNGMVLTDYASDSGWLCIHDREFWVERIR